MTDDASRRPDRRQWLLAVAVGSIVGLLVLGVVTVLEIDLGLSLAVSPHRVTVGTVVAAILLLAGSIAIPAYVLSEWQAAQEENARERRD